MYLYFSVFSLMLIFYVGHADLVGDTLSSATEVVESLVTSLQQTDSLPSIPDYVDHNGIIADYKAGMENEDAHLKFPELVKKYGYSVEEHAVDTEDNYVLTLYRLVNNGPVVFLMHGLLGSSDDYITAGPESGIAYLLFQAGYDVWLGNARGNKYSRKHKFLSPSKPRFWDFSWHEIGYYDLAALIDYTLNHTGQLQLKYIGHSQGTTTFFVLTSERPEYNNKVSLMVALSPVAWVSHIKSPILRLLAPGTPLLTEVLQAIGKYEFLPDRGITKLLKSITCSTIPLTDIFCANILFLIFGFDYQQLNVTNLPVLYGHVPSGIATKQLTHYAQGVNNGQFRQFDYGLLGNIERYGDSTPPRYKVELISTNISLFHSEGDWLAHPKDVANLESKLPNVVDSYNVPFKKFNHIDFVWALDVKTLIFDKIAELFSRY